MRKIKLLMVPSDLQGVGHFRSIWPAKSLLKQFGDQIEIEVNSGVNVNNITYMSSFDIIHFHRALGPYEETEKLCKTLRENGVITIMDIDDFWEPPTTHPLYEIVKRDGLTEKIVNNLRCVDYATTTTEVFKKHILPYNKNVEVIPNALDMDDKMWTSEVEENQTDMCRISWIGGSSHLHDLKLMEQSFNLLNSASDLEDKYQLILCGFDTRGTITQIDQNNNRTVRKIEPHETIWCLFENIFTSNLKLVKDEDYKKWLKKIKREDYPDEYKKNYIRRWTLPLTQYGKHYNYCDVCLAPLQEEEYVTDEKGTVRRRAHLFNEVKSELKIIEAGMKKKALIAQDFGIYKYLLKDGETGVLVKDNKDGWYKAMRKVILDKDFRESLANNLHNFVKDKYDLQSVSKKRFEFYKKVFEERKSVEILSDEKANS